MNLTIETKIVKSFNEKTGERKADDVTIWIRDLSRGEWNNRVALMANTDDSINDKYAQLFAAAPEMLAMLEKLNFTLVKHSVDEEPLKEKLFFLIKKAKGETSEIKAPAQEKEFEGVAV